MSISGSHTDFIEYIFSKPPGTIKEVLLQMPINDENKNINLHIFEQLLMIFTDGVKYFHGINGTVDVNKLTIENIEKINKYFISFGYSLNVDKYDTINDYKFKYPNYFKNQEHITKDTKLEDFYYEIYNEYNNTFRISFKILK
jgi:hypothetical protein